MIYTKCPICKKGNPFEVCCGQDKASGKKIYTIFDFIKNLFKKKNKPKQITYENSGTVVKRTIY
jgi:hypothetical protein